MGDASEDVAHVTEVTPRALNTTRSHNLRRILPVMYRVVVHGVVVSAGDEHTIRLNGKSPVSKHLDRAYRAAHTMPLINERH